MIAAECGLEIPDFVYDCKAAIAAAVRVIVPVGAATRIDEPQPANCGVS